MKHLPLLVAMLAFMIPGWPLDLGFYKFNFEELVVIVGLLFFLGASRFRFSKPFLMVFGTIFCIGFWHMLIGNNDINFIKVYLGMVMAYLFNDYILRRNRFELGTVINFYLNGAFIIALVGVIQFISAKVGFQPGYQYDWIFPTHRLSYDGFMIRINSYFGEASQVGQILAPAFFFSICSLFGIKPAFISKKKALFIIFVYFMSKSSLAMLGIVFGFGLLAIHYMSATRMIQIMVAVPLVFVLIINQVDNFRSKLETAYFVMNSGLVSDHSIVGGSFFTLYENTLVATENFKHHPFTGTGVGSHHVAYNKYALSKNNPSFSNYLSYNTHDASSLFNRMLSEMGLIGLGFLLIYALKNFVVKRDGEYNAYWIISSASLLVLIVSLIRKGHYFGGGLALFILMIYYINLDYQRYLRSNKEIVIEVKPV